MNYGFKALAKSLVALLLTGLLVLLGIEKGHAVPSFARQTGMSCNACHTVWPELTPFGRAFKLGGYTMSTRSPSEGYIPPITGSFQGSYTSLSKDGGVLTDSIAPFSNAQDSATAMTNLPQEAALYYAGRITEHLGTFAHMTYSGTNNQVALNLTEFRYARATTVATEHLVFGATLNNSPGMEDVWNNVPVWGFPFVSSDVAPTPAASTLIDGGLDMQVGGIGAYASWNNFIYGAFTVYSTTNEGIARLLGAGTEPSTVTDGAVPYWRVALYHQWNKHSFEIGTYGIYANAYPSGLYSGSTNSFTDYAFDAEYQYISNPHMFSVHATWIHEDQDWHASFPLGLTANPSDTLKTFKANVGYFYRSAYGTLGGTVAYFSTTGTTDTGLYGPDPVEGSNTGSPNSNGFILEADYVLKEKYKFSAQYTIYKKFNGASSNYDGFDRDASDNNTLYLLVWLMF
jgi:hypothetical protein